MFKSYFNFKGSIKRKGFLIATILSIVSFTLSFAVALIDLLLCYAVDYKPGVEPSLGIIGGSILFLATITMWFFLAQCTKRLRDISMSSLWLIVLFIPIANIILLVYLLTAKSIQNTTYSVA